MGIPLLLSLSRTPRLSSSCNSTSCMHRVAGLALVPRGEIAFSINPDLAVMSGMSTSIRGREGVAYSAPSSLNSHNALHRSQISNLSRSRGRKEGKERAKSAKTSAALFFAPFLSLICSLSTGRGKDESGVPRKHRSSLFLTNSLVRWLPRPETGRPTHQKEDNSLITIAGELPAYPPQMDGWIMQRMADPSSSCRPY